MRAVLYSIFFVSIGVIVGTVMLGFKTRMMQKRPAHPPVTVPAPSDFEVPAWPHLPVEPRVPVPAAPAAVAPQAESDPRPARPRMDFQMRQKIDEERYKRVLERFYPGELDPPDARLRLLIRVASDGKVVEAKTEESTFANPAFEAALLEEVKRAKYPDDDRYRTTPFAFEFKSAKPLPRRPLAEIEIVRDALLLRIEERRRTILASSTVPADARLKVVYRVLPSGVVDEARLASSSYRSTAFGRAVIDEVRRLRFAPNTGYATTEFTYEYGEGGVIAGNAARR